jgi:hypothetical protein
MTLVKIGNRYYPFPDRWNDLSGKQVIAIMKIFCSETDLPVHIAGPKFFKILSNASWLKLCLNSLDVQENIHLVEWLFEPDQKNILTKNPIPKRKRLYGPADRLDNLCAKEFFWAQHFYDAWTDSKSVNDLNKLVATLYRRANPKYNVTKDDDIRESFNSNAIDFYEKKVRRWPLQVKFTIAHWFKHCFLWYKQSYKEAFEPGGEIARFGFASVLRGIAERGTHGTFEQVEKINIHLLFIELVEIIRADKKLKES